MRIKSDIYFCCRLIMIFIIASVIIFACGRKDDDNESLDYSGRVVFNFLHYDDGKPLVSDTMKYIDAAGNPYEVSEVMCFISDITFY